MNKKKKPKEESLQKDDKILNKKIKNSELILEDEKIDNDENENSKKDEIDNININNFRTNPIYLTESIDLVQDSYMFDNYNNNDTFCLFESIDNIFYLIYSNNNKSIISFNIIDNKKINEIKNAHIYHITQFRHFLDQANQRDLILSISLDRNIKIWNINKIECILNLNNIYKNGNINSACFLNNNGEILITTSNYIYYYEENDNNCIKVYNLKGDKIKDINDSKERIYFADTYYDDKKDTNYIIITTKEYIKSYNYNLNELYHKYYKKIDNKYKQPEYKYITMSNFTKTLKIIESTNFGNIRIWDFHSGRLLKKLIVNINKLNGICLWNKNIY